MIYPKNRPKQTCDYWLITLNQQNLFIETNLLRAGNYKLARWHLQNNTVNGATSISINRVIINTNFITIKNIKYEVIMDPWVYTKIT